MPWLWNSVAPHSSTWICASLEQNTKPPGRLSAASPSEFDAVPVPVNHTCTSVSKTSENNPVTRRVSASLP